MTVQNNIDNNVYMVEFKMRNEDKSLRIAQLDKKMDVISHQRDYLGPVPI